MSNLDNIMAFLICVAFIFTALLGVDIATTLYYKRAELRNARAYRNTNALQQNAMIIDRRDIPFDQEKE